jgi:signal transduction histidine kinase
MSSSSAGILSPLPQAPTAVAPAGLSVDGAAAAAWHPNVLQWVAVWRVLVVAEGVIAVLLAGTAVRGDSTTTLLAAAGYALASIALAAWRPEVLTTTSTRVQLGLLVFDLAACMVLLASAQTQTAFALMALYSYSSVLAWAARRPIDAFVAGGIGAVTYTVLALNGPYADHRPAAFVSNLALYGFFALATSGFFTVAHRIGALEIATEISKERGRYRRDLHDRLGQALCGLHFELQAVHASGLDDAAEARLSSLADGYRDAGVMLADLFRQTDEPLVATNIASLIQQEARRMSQQTGTRIDVAVDGYVSRVPPWMRPHVWAVAGECMHNAVKNGEAHSIEIDLNVTDDLLVLSVTDDGVGFDNPPGTITEKTGHYGLREMAERARICGGEVVIASQVGFGARVRLQIPMPDGATEDLIERDASKLRENVWTLFSVLRLGLGLVALAQLAIGWGTASSQAWIVALAAFVAIDVIYPAVRSRQLFATLSEEPRLLVGAVLAYGVAFGASLAADVPPWFMLYAPLVLLAGGVLAGRSVAARLTVLFAALCLGMLAIAAATGMVDQHEAQTSLLYITNLVLIGMSATQGAKLLDRLEALQIRVRYQALARLRQGLGSRMRDQLTERLDALEAQARDLAVHPGDAATFETSTATLEQGSTELKASLREIVHQLADPSPTQSAGRA